MDGYAPRPLPAIVPPQAPQCAPRRHWVSLVEHCNGPMVAAFSRRPSISDRTPRTTPRIDHQLRTGAEPPPLRCHWASSVLSSGVEFTRTLPKPLGAVLWHNCSHLAQPAGSRERARGCRLTAVTHQHVGRGELAGYAK